VTLVIIFPTKKDFMSEDKNSKKTGLSTAGLVLGVIAIVLSFIPIINNLAFVLAILALIFGIIGVAKKHGGKAIAATILAILSIIITLVVQKAASDALTKAVEDNFGTNSTNDDGSASIFADSKGLELEGEPVLDTSGMFAKVKGTVVNNSDVTYNSPTVSFHAADANGNAIDGCSDSMMNGKLEPNQKWNFEASCFSSTPPASVKLDKISHF
jgi:hypothetical protein